MSKPDAAAKRKAAAERRLLKDKFLAAYATTGNVSAAAKLAEVSRQAHYDWLKADKRYAAAFEQAVEEAADRLETEARRRAMSGVAEPVFYKGEKCGAIQKYSDTLLIFLLKGARPERYAQHHVVGGKGKNGAIPLERIVAGLVDEDK